MQHSQAHKMLLNHISKSFFSDTKEWRPVSEVDGGLEIMWPCDMSDMLWSVGFNVLYYTHLQSNLPINPS